MKHDKQKEKEPMVILRMMAVVLCVFFSFQTRAQDTSWYSDSETVFTLTTADQMIGFRNLVRNGKTFKEKTIKLGNDIDVSSVNWLPIGGRYKPFCGTFDGCGYNITYSCEYVYNTTGTDDYHGLFAYISNATIKNLRVSGILSVRMYVNRLVCCGAIVGYASNSIIYNCSNSVNISYNRPYYLSGKYPTDYKEYIGGICGSNYNSKISYCVNTGKIEDLTGYGLLYVGGICGSVTNYGEVYGCESLGNIETGQDPGDMTGYVGGVAGYSGIRAGDVEGTISYCRFTGVCTTNKAAGSMTAGIVGFGSCKNCYVASKKIASETQYAPQPICYRFGKAENCFANNDIVGVNTSEKAGINLDYSLSQMKTVEFVNALNESGYMWVGGEGVLPVVLGSMNETEAYTTRPRPEAIALSSDNIDMALDSDFHLTASVLPEFSWPAVTWESSNPNIVSVSDEGLLTGNAVGNATITATSTRDTNVKAECQVHVGTKDVTGITLPETLDVYEGHETTILPTILPSYAEYQLKWTSEDETIATVDNDGKVTAKVPGETTISVVDELTGISAQCTVQVISTELTEISVSNQIEVKVNGTAQIVPELSPSYAECQFVWSSANEAIAAVDQSGNVTGVGIGETTVSVRDERTGKEASCKVSVIPNGNFSAETPEGVLLTFALKDKDQKTCYVKGINNKKDERFITIPSEVYGYSVVEIGESAFSEAWISGVTVPGSVKTIDNLAFYSSKVVEVDLQEGVQYINDAAFQHAVSLEKINIPASIKEIGLGAFTTTLNLERVNITDLSAWLKIDFGGSSANPLDDNSSKLYVNGIALTSLTIPSDVSSIKNWAFQGYDYLTGLSIPSHVTSIGNNAFAGCADLKSVTVESTTPLSITDNSFSYSYGSVLNVPRGCRDIYSNTQYWNWFLTIVEPPYANGETLVAPIKVDDETTDATFKVIDAENLKMCIGSGEEAAIADYTSGNIVVSASVAGADGQTYQVAGIGNFAFAGCSEITSVSIPEGVNSIGEGAFYYCTALTSVALPQSLTSIGESAFLYCEQLPAITIPRNVTSIGENAFAECSALTAVTVERTEPIAIDADCFTNAASATLNVPVGSKPAYKAATGWKDFGKIVDGTENQLKLVASTGRRGGVMTLPVYMDNEEQITAIQFELALPENITVNGQSLSDRAADHSVACNRLANGNYQFTVFSFTSSLLSGNDGVLVNIGLKIDAEVSEGDYIVELKNIVLSTRAKEITPADQQATLTIDSVLPGDVDGNGRITIFDAVQVVNYILELSPDNFNAEAADVDGNGRITIFDAVTIVNQILGITPAASRQERVAGLDPQ